MTKLRIASDGSVRGLWTDEVDWASIGRVSVCRASHVEFCDRRQLWYVRPAGQGSWVCRLAQWLLGLRSGEIIHWAASRAEALAWERAHYQPGGSGWLAASGQQKGALRGHDSREPERGPGFQLMPGTSKRRGSTCH